MKTDLTKKFKEYYQAPKSPELVSFEPGLYLAIDGQGEPAGTEFTSKVEALYPVAYGIKKLCKARKSDFAVPKLEGLWSVDGARDARDVPRNQWKWTLLIRMPDFVSRHDLAQAIEEVVKKKKLQLAQTIRLEEQKNGKCVHVMHIGPYSDEPKTIDSMHEFIRSKRLRPSGLHHEIYLSDPRKTAPSKMKTVLRQPVA